MKGFKESKFREWVDLSCIHSGWGWVIDFLGCYRPLRLAWKSAECVWFQSLRKCWLPHTTTRANWLYHQSTKTLQGMEYSNQCFRNAPGSSIDCKPMFDPIGSGCCLLLHFLLTKPITGSKVNMPTMFDLKLQQINPECSGTRTFVIYQPQQRQPQLATKQCLAMSMSGNWFSKLSAWRK